MKKIAALVSVLGLAVLTGCIKATETAETKNAWNVIDDCSAWGSTGYKVIEVEGHRYLVVRAPKGVSVVHAESCPCKARRTGASVF